MNQKIKELWINALRSGEYKQGQHALRTQSGYCCLGVLCDLAAKAGIGEWKFVSGAWMFVSKNGVLRVDTLPPSVREWAGVKDANPDTHVGSLAYNNDSGRSFEQIAALIQVEL